VFREFARLVCQTFRDTDAVFRYGGEEFTALLPLGTWTAACQRFVARVAAPLAGRTRPASPAAWA
jgi:GGDEF domain-containing protein